MSQVTQKPTIDSVKKSLEEQKALVEKQLERLKSEDPFLTSGDRSHIEEPGTIAMEEDGHIRIEGQIKESERLLNQINKALAKITAGKYGTCDSCGKPIEAKRLAVFSMATLCLVCEQKKEKRSN